MSKHTPGPWEMRGLTIFEPGKVALSIASITQHEPNARANARLIAAAPDILEALKGLLADIQDYQRINNLGGDDNHWQAMARAAIAKTEGRS